MRTTWNFHSAGQLTFGAGAARRIGRMLGRRGWNRALIVTDPVLAKAGPLDAVLEPLRDAGIATEVFEGGEPEPSVAAAERAIETARRGTPSVIIGLGGGSNIDLAKIAAAVHRNQRLLQQTPPPLSTLTEDDPKITSVGTAFPARSRRSSACQPLRVLAAKFPMRPC